jgi:hypothetical protein
MRAATGTNLDDPVHERTGAPGPHVEEGAANRITARQASTS